MHKELRKAAPLCGTHGIGLAEAAVRWLLYHSALDADGEDGVVVGPSDLSQLDGYVKARDAGPVPEGLARGLVALWNDEVKEAAASNIEYSRIDYGSY